MNTVASPRAVVAGRLRAQAGWAAKLGSPLYAELLSRSAEDVEAGGAAWDILAGHENDADGLGLGLRFMGAVHRLVLQGGASELAACYPSTGGRCPAPGEVWPVFRSALAQHVEALRPLLELPVQTNEVRRCAALLGGFLLVARGRQMPLRLLELGASAGLNLRFDHYRYEWQGGAWGPADANLRLTDVFRGAAPSQPADLRVVERGGCDLRPIDPATPSGQLTLKAYIWADQPARFSDMIAAVDIAARVPARITAANAPDWLAAELQPTSDGIATVVFHSMVWPYLGDENRQRVTRILDQAGRRASSRAPLAWLRMEPAGDLAEVRLTTWPGGDELLIARSGYHGIPVEWLAA